MLAYGCNDAELPVTSNKPGASANLMQLLLEAEGADGVPAPFSVSF